MSMVEKVARAIYAAYGFHLSWGEASFTWRDQCLKQGRAAIEAMREPTDEMSCAGLDFDDDDGKTLIVSTVWQAMIDAALKESE